MFSSSENEHATGGGGAPICRLLGAAAGNAHSSSEKPRAAALLLRCCAGQDAGEAVLAAVFTGWLPRCSSAWLRETSGAVPVPPFCTCRS